MVDDEQTTFATAWPEIVTAFREQRYELVLQGNSINAKIEKQGGLDKKLFDLINLNFLRISSTCLCNLPDDIGCLTNLRNLALDNNKLRSVPSSLGNLVKLKLLDLSYNNIDSLPDEIGALKELTDLNLVCNQLSALPDSIGNLKNLARLNVSNNQLSQLPLQLCRASNMGELRAANNVIDSLIDNINDLNLLKILDLSHNKIAEVPHQLGLCNKLRDLSLIENPIKDRKCIKLIRQNNIKLLMDYLRDCNAKARKVSGKLVHKEDAATCGSSDADSQQNKITLYILTSNEIKIHASDQVRDVRPYIVCAIMKGVKLGQPDKFRRFFALQTRLHDTICNKRLLATIATHDLRCLEFPLRYEVKAPSEISVIPLGKDHQITAKQLVDELVEENNVTGRARRKNKNVGLQKYVALVKESKLFAYIADCNNNVLSLPPLTNCNKTKITSDCQEIFLEVTSAKSLALCKKVMDVLIESIIDVVVDYDSNKIPISASASITVEQVRISDQAGSLKVVYPARTDLNGIRSVIEVKRV